LHLQQCQAVSIDLKQQQMPKMDNHLPISMYVWTPNVVVPVSKHAIHRQL
jgi:hypothetical protein